MAAALEATAATELAATEPTDKEKQMGLLEDFKMPGMDTPEGQGLMSAAFSLMSAQKMPGQRGGIGNAIGQAGQQYLGTTNTARDAMQRRKMGDMQMQTQQLQLEEAQRRQMQEQRAEAERKRIAGLIGGAGVVAPGMGSGLSHSDSADLPREFQTGVSFPALQKPGQIDYQSLFRQGVPLDMLKGLSESANMGRAKVKNIETVSIGGKPMKVGIDEYGQQVAQIGMEWKPLKTMDMGGYMGAFDETNPGAGVSKIGDKMQSAESVASNATAIRGQNMSDARARDFNAVQVEANNIKRTEKKDTADLTKNSQVAGFDTMLGTLDRLSKHPGLSRSVGAFGVLPTMPGSDSANFQAELNTFQSQAFLPMVAQLKGMGALSDAEGKKITAAVGALDPKMGETAFRESVARITADMEAARARLSGQPLQPKAPSPEGSWASAPMKGQVIDGYKFKGGDPAQQSNWEKK